MGQEINIFAIYAWEDKNVMLHLLRHLKNSTDDLDVTVWHDDPIETGQLWKPQEESKVDRTDVFLLLISTDFMNSQFINQLAFKNIIDRYKADKVSVIPIIVDECRWDIDFKADDYNFNLNELDVLPDSGNPIENWTEPDQAFKNIATGVRKAIAVQTGVPYPDGITEVEENTAVEEDIVVNDKLKEQTVLDFEHEVKEVRETEDLKTTANAEVDKRKTEELRLEAEAATKLKEAEELKLSEVEEINKRNAEELRLEAEAATKLKEAEEKKLIKEEADKRRAEELRLKTEAANKLKAVEKQKLIEAEEADKRRAEELRLETEAATQLKEAEELKLREVEDANKRSSEEEYKPAIEAESKEYNSSEEKEQQTGNKSKRSVLVGLLLALLFIGGIWGYSVFDKDKKEESVAVPEKVVPEILDSVVLDNAKTDKLEVEKKAVLKLAIGDKYQGGIIFTIDASGKKGKMIYPKNSGKMSWQKAMKIQEELGEEWRLPTLNELVLIYKTVGQGANNIGQFSEELYWSSTSHDSNQAKLLRFTDGNTSYHYNKNAEYRKFQIRAVRDFSR